MMARYILKIKETVKRLLKRLKMQLETYEPKILPNWLTQFINARATARFSGG